MNKSDFIEFASLFTLVLFAASVLLTVFLVKRATPNRRARWFFGCAIVLLLLFGISKGPIAILASSAILALLKMFEVLKYRWYLARVQAELKAQYNDQEFVDLICQLPSNQEKLHHLHKHAYYRKEKIAPFMAVCFVLSESLESSVLPHDKKTICAELLGQRLQKISTDPHFRMRHIEFIDELEMKLADWTLQLSKPAATQKIEGTTKNMKRTYKRKKGE